jgi:hypothetical protein
MPIAWMNCFQTIQSLLLSYSGIETVTFDPVSNKITLTTVCNPPEYLVGADISVEIKIKYSINCITCS